MYSIVFRKIDYETIKIQNTQEYNRDCIHLVYEIFSIKQYVSTIFKKIIENVFICFPKYSL